MKKEFFTFLLVRETPPQSLSHMVKKDIQLSFQGTQIILKFLALQVVGAFFSLSFCPQFGIGSTLIHGVLHVLDQFGDWACAMFCGSLFLSTGALMVFLGMKGEEIWWVWRRYSPGLMVLPVFMWGSLMLMGKGSFSVEFHFSWIVAALGTMVFLHFLRGRIYLHSQSLNA